VGSTQQWAKPQLGTGQRAHADTIT
jgi:hypothetical protein